MIELSPVQTPDPVNRGKHYETYSTTVADLINHPSQLSDNIRKKCKRVLCAGQVLFNVPKDKMLGSLAIKKLSSGSNGYHITAKDHEGENLQRAGDHPYIYNSTEIKFVCDPIKDVSGELPKGVSVTVESAPQHDKRSKTTRGGTRIPSLHSLSPTEQLIHTLTNSIKPDSTHAQNITIHLKNGDPVILTNIIPISFSQSQQNQGLYVYEFQRINDNGSVNTRPEKKSIIIDDIASIEVNEGRRIPNEELIRRQLVKLISENPASAERAIHLKINTSEGNTIDLGSIVLTRVDIDSFGNYDLAYRGVTRGSGGRYFLDSYSKTRTVDLSRVRSIESSPGLPISEPRRRYASW